MTKYKFTFYCIDNGGKKQCFTVKAVDKAAAIAAGMERAKKHAAGNINNWECTRHGSLVIFH